MIPPTTTTPTPEPKASLRNGAAVTASSCKTFEGDSNPAGVVSIKRDYVYQAAAVAAALLVLMSA